MDLSTLQKLMQAQDPRLKFSVMDFLDERPVEVVDQLDPQKHSRKPGDVENLLANKVDFLIWDDYVSPELALEARNEASQIYKDGQMKDAGTGKEKVNDKAIRSDKLFWITDRKSGPLSEISSMHEQTIESLFDGKEVQLAIYPGEEQPAHYLRHRDAILQDLNNRQGHQRILTIITYLNPELSENQGDLRLYLDSKIIDVRPRLGRTIVFRSTVVEHEVRPSAGYNRFAVTTWLHDLPVKQIEQKPSDPNGTIFVGIPSYRDFMVVDTVNSLFEKAQSKSRVFVHIFLQHDLNNDTDS